MSKVVKQTENNLSLEKPSQLLNLHQQDQHVTFQKQIKDGMIGTNVNQMMFDQNIQGQQNNRISPAKPMNVSQSQVSPRLMQQAHSYKQDTADNYNNQGAIEQKSFSHTSAQGATIATTGNLIVGTNSSVKNQSGPTTASIPHQTSSVVPLSAAPHMKNQHQKGGQFRKNDAIKDQAYIHQNMAGINEFKNKVNMMLQNHMYMNVGQQNDANKTPFGYEADLNNMEDNRFNKMNKIETDFNSSQGNNNLKNILLKNNRNYSNSKHNTVRKVGSKDEGEATDKTISIQAEGGMVQGEVFQGSDRINKNGQYDAVNTNQQQPQQSGLMIKQQSSQGQVFSPLNSQPKSSKKLQIANGSISSETNKQLHKSETKGKTPLTYIVPGGAPGSGVVINSEKQGLSSVAGGIQGTNPVNSYSSYSSNNQKQQQRRRLLFEYGMEKKMQNQGSVQPVSTSQGPSIGSTQLSLGGQDQSSYGGYARAIQSNGIAMHVGPNRDSGGPWTRSNVGMADSANRQNKARLYGGFSTSNGSATGASTTLSTLISRNGASDKYRRDTQNKGGKPGDETKEAQEIHKKIEQDDYNQFQSLLDSLKHINIDKLDIRDQEQLCFLSEQYQFHMQQFKEMKVTENIIMAEKDQKQMPTQSSDLRQGNNFSQFSKRSDGENQDAVAKAKIDGKDKEIKSEVYSSQDRFKENEKNLSEFRLQRNRQNMKTKEDDEQNTPASILERDQGLELNRQNSKKLMYNMENKTAQGIREDEENGARKLTDSKKSLMTMAGTSVINNGNLPQMPMSSNMSDKNLKRNGSIQRLNSDNQKMIQQQPVYVNELTSTTNTTGTNATTGANQISKNYQPSIFDQLKNPGQNTVQPYQPVPPPEMNIALIKQLTHQQRINVFKVLQKREKGKFMGIQQKKLQKQTIGLHESIDKTYKSSRKGFNDNFKSGDSKSQNDRFLDIVRRQGGNHHAANNLSIQKLEQIRKQWVADLKAFGIFQQNELWQFGQMNEQQQKQILICNLQQGKFENLNVSLILNEGISGQPRSSLWQQHQQRQAYGSALDKMNDPQMGDNKNQQPLTPVRNSVNFTGNRHGQYQNKNFKHTENQLDNVQVVEPLSSGAVLQGGQSSNRSRSKSDQQQNPDADRSSLNTIDKTININVKNLSETKSVVPQTQPLSKMHVYSDMTTVNKDAQRTAREGNEDQIEKLYYLAQRGDSGSNLDNKQGGLKMQNDYYNESLSQHNFVNSPTYKVKNGLGTDETFSAEMMGDAAKEETIKMLRKQTNPITRRYEDSKSQFEACLHAILAKHNSNNLPGQVYQRKYRNVSIDNLIPNFPKHLLNNKANEIEKYRPKFRTEKSSSFNNHSSSIHGFQNGIASNKLNKNKDNLKKDGTATDPKLKKEEDKKDDKKENDNKEEAPPEEPKKPRYFPPRRIPNPFESAAQEQEKFLQARKEALAKYSNISKNRFKQDESMPLKYVIRPGNNSKLIMRVLENSGRLAQKFDADGETIIHPGWEPADDHLDSLYNFKWKPTSGGIKWDMISKHGLKQLVNHVKGHGALTTKDNLFLNMKQYYESQKLNIYDIVPLTIVLDYLRDDVGERVEQFVQIMKVIEKNINEDVNVLNQKLHESQLQKEKTLKTPFKLSECCHNNQNLWMLKPTGFNRGIGIHIFQTFDQLRDIMSNHYGIGRGQRDKTSIFQTHNHNHNHRENISGDVDQNKQHKNFTFVLQKLIERPLLYNQRKFDIRQWVLFNASDGKIYMFAEPYVRTSSSEYKQYDPNVAEEEQIFMQLTNNAVQKDGEAYGKYEEGNIVSIGTLFKFIASQPLANGKSAQELEKDFKTSMINVIIDTIKSVKGKINMQKHCFELLGYDFIFDENLNTILIEVNTNPCLEESNALLKKLLPRMVDDLLNITMDPLFQNDSGKYISKFPIKGDIFGEDLGHPGYKDDENLYKHIYTIDNFTTHQ